MKTYLRPALLLAGLAVATVQAAPFVPRAEIPAGMEETYLAESISGSAIPEAERVGIPAYPGAVMIRSYAVNERPTGYTGLPVVELITTDAPDTVVAFYKAKLPGWGQAELMSAYYFARHGNINFFKPEEPHVGVHRMSSYYREADRELLQRVLPGARTLIKIWY